MVSSRTILPQSAPYDNHADQIIRVIHIRRPVREIHPHARCGEHCHTQDDRAPGRLQPAGQPAPPASVPDPGCSKEPEGCGIDERLHLPGLSEPEGEKAKPGPCKATGRTGIPGEAHERTDAAEHEIEKQKTGDYRNNRPFYISDIGSEQRCRCSDTLFHIQFPLRE